MIILLSVTTARLLRGFGVSRHVLSSLQLPVSARGSPLTLSEAVVSASTTSSLAKLVQAEPVIVITEFAVDR